MGGIIVQLLIGVVFMLFIFSAQNTERDEMKKRRKQFEAIRNKKTTSWYSARNL